MAGQRVGIEIDKSSCIWRMNNAPTKGYEEDVGKRTTVRVVSHTSVPLLLKNPEYFFKETNNTVYVIWGPFRNMRRDGNGIVYNMLKKTVDSYPTAKIYVTTEKRMSYCDAIFKKETGKDRSECLESGLHSSVLHPGSLGFPVSATSHIYDTDIKEAQEIEDYVMLVFAHTGKATDLLQEEKMENWKRINSELEVLTLA
ncbi:hypothetical protein DUI87_14804 [Hirundo rustica rustica]|uniref:Alpha-N-acetylgalactosaminide alpha-2,6-sialyltransferase 3 n=1 Tax=Hirundo rustica rustica TaxID=333673 RepID=A0A3M0KMX1_HIRRU|nr:hypothetical protein DUI87_14804 [Hirundo rustica rustica]